MLAAYGINKGSDLIALGTLVTLISTSAGVYMISDTVRPSGAVPKSQEKT
jgi:hypothetical protein